MYFSCGGFDVKWAEEHLHVVKYNNIYIFIFLLLLTATSFVQCSPLFPRIESAILTFKDIRAAMARASWQRVRATWIPDQWLNRESVHHDVQRSKTCCEVGGLNCSAYNNNNNNNNNNNCRLRSGIGCEDSKWPPRCLGMKLATGAPISSLFQRPEC